MTDPVRYAGTGGLRVRLRALLRGRRTRAGTAARTAFYQRPAACFVTLKKRGELRGCIGTLEPAETALGGEIARNAHSSALHDPRFPPVSGDEVEALTCSVDVLGSSEPCEIADLDPEVYGVIVASGHRRGVLLPALQGIDSADQQVAIALQKAGIAPDDGFDVRRFRVTRYRQGDRPAVGRRRPGRATDPTSVTGAPPVVALFGATALGKSDVALELASRLGADIVVADSMQIYAGLPIITNQPGDEARARVRYHLVGWAPAQDDFTVAEYADRAHAAVDAALEEGRSVVAEGGSGLYLRALLGGLAFGGPPDPARRAELEARWEREPEALVAELRRRAPAVAAHVDVVNGRRVIRALESLDAPGEKQTGELWEPGGRYRHGLFALLPDEDRAALKERIGRRVDQMLAAGALEEVAAPVPPARSLVRRLRRSACASSAPSSTASSRCPRRRRA